MASTRAVDVADVKILDFVVTDIRFPTSLDGVGSDAMHVGTNGSHPYLQLKTSHAGLVGEGIVRFNSREALSIGSAPMSCFWVYTINSLKSLL